MLPSWALNILQILVSHRELLYRFTDVCSNILEYYYTETCAQGEIEPQSSISVHISKNLVFLILNWKLHLIELFGQQKFPKKDIFEIGAQDLRITSQAS